MTKIKLTSKLTFMNNCKYLKWLGEHTDSVLKDILGLSPQQILQYRQQGVIS